MLLPTRRTVDILEQVIGKELLIYDLRINKAYNLNETLRTVYNVCDGQTTFDDLKRRFKYTDDLIYLALDELQKNNLIEGDKIAHFAGMNRREVIRKVGLGTMFALPIISALAAPSAAQAASNCIFYSFSCTFDDNRQSNCCTSNLRCLPAGGGYQCLDCFGTGSIFAVSATASVASCNADPQKNRCCNSTADATVNGPFCVCP